MDRKMTGQLGFRLVLAVIALGVLGACGAPTVSRGHTEFGYTRGEILLATAGQPLKVETFGVVDTEAPAEQGTVDSVVAESMSRYGPNWFGGTYAVAPDAEPDPRYRLRWLFNVPLGFRSHGVCGKGLDEAAAGWTEPTGQVLAAFCRRERSLSYTYGSLGDDPDMNTKSFSRFIGSMGLELLPPIRQNQDRRCRNFMVCS
jgi:hypothetical protein